jgi:hypothetical protein
MAFGDFRFPEVEALLGLRISDGDLATTIAPLKLRDEFVATIREGTDLALAINTEKARSEFVIAPILLELKRMLGGTFAVFSGVEFNVDASRGLNGVCDFILTKDAKQVILTSPVVTMVEAKNDNVHYGYGQCVAQMVAAWVFNEQHKTPASDIYGVVTTGTAWLFMKLKEKDVTIDRREYYVNDLGKIMGILTQMIRGV